LKKKSKARTLAVIPCYNEEATIGTIVLKAKRHVDEVMVIDDGSIDGTAKVAKYAGAKVLSHGGRKGYGAAIQTCFKYARGKNFDVMTVLDGDGQHEADQIKSVMKPILDKGIDISSSAIFAYAKLTTTENDVKNLINSLKNIKIKSIETTPISILAKVPVGQEKNQIKKVKRHKNIRYAELNGYTDINIDNNTSNK